MSNRIAVMRAGRIEQLDTPSELYERPQTEFVAGFLGVSNLLDGEVVGRNGELAEIRLTEGTIVRVPSSATDGSGRVRIGVRPEKLRVVPVDDGASDPSAVNWVNGRVIDASYVGVSTQYLVRTADGHDLTVYAQNLETSGRAEILAAGQPVRLTWRPQHTFVIARREESPQSEEGGRSDA